MIWMLKMGLCCWKVFAWGCGSCLGCGSAEATALRPRVVEDLNNVRIVDIACGDSHCVALSAGEMQQECRIPSPQGQRNQKTKLQTEIRRLSV